jgi:CSLREA domain-containing protein
MLTNLVHEPSSPWLAQDPLDFSEAKVPAVLGSLAWGAVGSFSGTESLLFSLPNLAVKPNPDILQETSVSEIARLAGGETPAQAVAAQTVMGLENSNFFGTPIPVTLRQPESEPDAIAPSGLGTTTASPDSEALQPSAPLLTLTVDTLVDENDGDLSAGDVSLREAIAAIDPGGTINFAPSLAGGTITLTLGQLNIDKTLTLNGLGANNLAVDGNNLSPVFQIFDGDASSFATTVTIDGLAIMNGSGSGIINLEVLNLSNSRISGNRASGIDNSDGTLNLISSTISGNSSQGLGGGIENANGTVNLIDSTVSGNSAILLGGGISNNGGLVSLTNSTVTQNSAIDGAGGIFNNSGSTVSLTHSVVSGNSIATGVGSGIGNAGTLYLAYSTLSGNKGAFIGGGIGNDSGRVDITDSIITGNSADFGGGIGSPSGNVTITRSTIAQNSAGNGGGISAFLSGKIEVISSTVANNRASENGGGIVNTLAKVSVVNSTISGNTADETGGGLGYYYTYGGFDIFNSTITNNTANRGGGVYSIAGFTPVGNSIIAGNHANRQSDLGGGDFRSRGNNLVGVGTSGFIDGVNGDQVGTSSAPLNPLLSPLQDNGGPTLTHALLSGSPAINAGNNALIPADTPYDQRGAGFPRIVGDIVDIGAFESNAVGLNDITVDTLVDEDDGDLTPGDFSLREALKYINPGGTINFTSSLSGGTITLALGELKIDKDLSIQGLGVDQLTISGNNNSRVFSIDDGNSSSTIDVVIDGLAITEGKTSSAGGGIFNQENLTLTESTIVQNSTTSAGGGIFNSGQLQVTNSTIAQNSAASGGGIANGGGTIEVTSSTLSGNRADSFGAGVFSVYDVSGSLIANSTISGNIANSIGGGIYNLESILTVTNSTVTNNSAENGGGVAQNIGLFEVGNSIISGNTDNKDIAGLYGYDFTSLGFNMIGNGDGGSGFINGVNGDLVGSTINPIDARLSALQDNGGLTLTHTLLPGSPAIDAGNSSLSTDQRGVPRPQGSADDIGAVEAIFKLTVDTLVDENDGDLSPGDVSLREAIQYINPGGTINFASSLSGGTIALTLGQLEINKDLTIQGLGAKRLTVSGNNSSRVFLIDDGDSQKNIKVGISGLTITQGNSAGEGGGIFNCEDLTLRISNLVDNLAQDGGGIHNQGSLRVVSSKIANNRATNEVGGGIENTLGTVTVLKSSISGNTAATNGGGIFSDDGTVKVIQSTISGNTSNSGSGIFAYGSSVNLKDSTISDNKAVGGDGGGIAGFGASSIEVTRSSIANNSADGNGGGFWLSFFSGVTLTNSTVSGNTAKAGGGIYSFYTDGGYAQVINSTISGNTADFGGGIYGAVAGLVVTDSTIAKNKANIDGGGILNKAGFVEVANSIIAQNSGNQDIDGDSFTSQGFNLIGNGDGADGFINGVNGDQVGTSLSPLDPLLSPLQNNGGSTLTHALLAGSTAIDAGNNALIPANTPYDQRGAGFPRIVGGIVDIGSFEVQDPLTAGLALVSNPSGTTPLS